MSRDDWLALAAEYDAEAQRQRDAGHDDAARLWHGYARSARDAAKKAGQDEPSTDRRTEIANPG